MDCPTCGHPNRADARFCGSCGAALDEAVDCAECGAANPAGQRFCDDCGAALAAVARPPARPATSARAPSRPVRPATPEHLATKIRAGAATLEGERKQVTVLFADVVGSMELAERSDPEDWRRIMDRFFAILCAGVHRFEGTVDKFTGDGVMAIFGAPIAHEDHAQRACYAALHLQRDLAAYAAELRRTEGLSLAVRMGINSGEVVVGAIGEDLGMGYTAIGHTVGLAQRMESLAEPGKAYLSERSGSLVDGYLELRDLGEFQVKGVGQPLRVYELTGTGPARGRLDVSRSRGFSRFVGRQDEVRVLERALEQAFAGEPQVIGMVGEAGVGKSRLCHEFIQRLRAKGTPVYHAAGHAHTKSVPLLPVLQLMRDYFDISDQDSDQTARERIAGKLLLLEESLADDLPLMFEFLGVGDPERPAGRMDPEARQRQILGLTKRLIRAQSAREPGVTLFEDLHWIDVATEAFVATHVEAVQGTRSLTVFNFRPEYQAPWMSKSYYRQIALAPLGPEAMEEMLRDLLGVDPSLAGLPDLIRERTRGNPFFVEEVVQSLVEAENLAGDRGAYALVRPVEKTAVPVSVQAVLAARIDRLPQREKRVLQAAAVIGKELPEPVLARVAELDRQELEDALRNLVAGEFVFEQEIYPEAIYAFKHPLTQEVAYGSQLGERRAAVHAAVARATAELYPERLDERAALLAQHWEAAGEALEAARWYARAGAWAGTSDPTQALAHWDRVRELADSLPESEETAALGLTARIFSLQYAWRLGTSHEEAEAIFTQAEKMASKAGDIHSRAVLLAIYGGIVGSSDGDAPESARLARQAIAIAEESGDPILHMSLGAASYSLVRIGENRESIAILDRALELADGDVTVAAGVGVRCPYAYCLIFKGGALINLGELDEARELIDRGMALAHEQEDIESVGWGHMWCAWHAYTAGDAEAAFAHAQQTVEIAERIGDSFSRAWSWQWLGTAEGMRGEWERSIEALERSRSISSERRAAVDAEPWRLAFLGVAHLGLGDGERGCGLIEQAVDLARTSGQPPQEMFASAALAQGLLDHRWPDARERIEAALARADELDRATEGGTFQPMIHIALARLAQLLGDEDQSLEELREAHRKLTEIGATPRAERLAAELTALAR